MNNNSCTLDLRLATLKYPIDEQDGINEASLKKNCLQVSTYVRECVSRRSLGHHLLHLQILELLVIPNS